ncbi:MAG: hypothetical protein DRO23_11215 [Thermoprotei archaeon]|nr:MAG: hypothetical protein DRO23_11215 [Thermoprotei archaeon]
MVSRKLIGLVSVVSLTYLFLKQFTLINVNVLNMNVTGEYLAKAILFLLAFSAFILWVYATIPYGFSSVFGRIFMGIMLFLGFKAVGEFLFLIPHFINVFDVKGVFHVIGGFMFIASYLPLYASLLILLCEQRVLVRKPIETANIYASIIFVGSLGLIWAYFVLFALKFFSEIFNFMLC